MIFLQICLLSAKQFYKFIQTYASISANRKGRRWLKLPFQMLQSHCKFTYGRKSQRKNNGEKRGTCILNCARHFSWVFTLTYFPLSETCGPWSSLILQNYSFVFRWKQRKLASGKLAAIWCYFKYEEDHVACLQQTLKIVESTTLFSGKHFATKPCQHNKRIE